MFKSMLLFAIAWLTLVGGVNQAASVGLGESVAENWHSSMPMMDCSFQLSRTGSNQRWTSSQVCFDVQHPISN